MTKKLESFSSTLPFHVCYHLDMPAVSLAFSNSRHGLVIVAIIYDYFVINFLPISANLANYKHKRIQSLCCFVILVCCKLEVYEA